MKKLCLFSVILLFLLLESVCLPVHVQSDSYKPGLADIKINPYLMYVGKQGHYVQMRHSADIQLYKDQVVSTTINRKKGFHYFIKFNIKVPVKNTGGQRKTFGADVYWKGKHYKTFKNICTLNHGERKYVELKNITVNARYGMKYELSLRVAGYEQYQKPAVSFVHNRLTAQLRFNSESKQAIEERPVIENRRIYVGKRNHLFSFNNGEGKTLLIPRNVNSFAKYDNNAYRTDFDMRFTVRNRLQKSNACTFFVYMNKKGASQSKERLLARERIIIGPGQIKTITIQNIVPTSPFQKNKYYEISVAVQQGFSVTKLHRAFIKISPE